MSKRRFQNGYTLIEIALVLVISLTMASWLLVSYHAREADERDNEAMAAMQSIKQAIIAYANSPANTARPYVLINGDPAVTPRRWQVPTGRPYLPCPDITGDGLEDRRPPPTAITLTLSAVTPVNYPAESGGDCYRSKGLVPWRTLGISNPSDPWGNYYTYRVAQNFSNAVVGFNQATRSDQSNYFRLLTSQMVGGQMVVSRPTFAAGGLYSTSAPAGGDVAGIWGSSNDSVAGPSLICNASPCSHTTPANLIVGSLASSLLTVTAEGYDVDAPVASEFMNGQIINGVPVVIVSHGQNGYGAVQFSSTGEFRCNVFPGGPGENDDERQNAYLDKSTMDCSIVEPSGSGAAGNGFVSRPVVRETIEDIDTFDDVVTWMTTEDLANSLILNGTLPAGDLPPVGLEGL